MGEIEVAAAGIDADGRIVAILEKEDRVGLVVLLEILQGFAVGEGQGADGHVAGDDPPHLRLDAGELFLGDLVDAVEMVKVPLAEGMPDDQPSAGEDALGRHGQEEAQGLAVQRDPGLAPQVDGLNGAVHGEPGFEAHDLIVQESRNEGKEELQKPLSDAASRTGVPTGNSRVCPLAYVTRTFMPCPGSASPLRPPGRGRCQVLSLRWPAPAADRGVSFLTDPRAL